MDGAPGHRIDDGLSQGRPEQRRAGKDQQGQPGRVCVACGFHAGHRNTPVKVETRSHFDLK